MKLLTSRKVIGHRNMAEYVAVLEQIAARNRKNVGRALARVRVDTAASPAVAYVNDGRWVADCPSPYCNAAMIVEPGQAYMCAECFNKDIGGAWRRVVWPEDAEEIDAELARRPDRRNQNWCPGETLQMLRAEAAARGVM